MSNGATRESQAAVVLIRERHEDDWAYLCQWSESWRALHFIGGHRHAGETFRECAIREAMEELFVGEADIAVSAEPLAQLEYDAFSEGARVQTWYVVAVFLADLAAAVRPAVAARPENRWVGREEILAGRTHGGTRVSPTANLILTKLGL
jgi:isopentenyldiphosphate isomerase